MAPMSGSIREIEVKIAFDSADEARRRIEDLAPKVSQSRTFEDNILYDLPGDELKAQGKVLRIRRVGDRAWLTYKEKIPSAAGSRHTERIERESGISHPDAVAGALEGLGFRIAYRYQKYRAMYRLPDLDICLDETPIGCFVELEGEPLRIDQVAERLGKSEADYIRRNYRTLHAERAAARGEAPGNMVFDR